MTVVKRETEGGQAIIRKIIRIDEEKCSGCGCINRCPVSAIQYGKRTVDRGRYVNPVLK